MIKFVNAKINLGLNVVSNRDDGYHNLETVFLPVGIESGMPQQPEAFDDILEITLEKDKPTGCRFQFMGRRVDCPMEKNLVVKGATLFLKSYFDKVGLDDRLGLFNIILDKHLPDGAGLGGGSADASFTLLSLNEILDFPFDDGELRKMALRLGADCPFFIYNEPCFAEGIGEVISPIALDVKGCWLLIVKPDIYVSTGEAFSGIVPKMPEFDLRKLPLLPLENWRGRVKNDFEDSVFPLFPELGKIKEHLYSRGAVYASMSGSGSSLYGIFHDGVLASEAASFFSSTYPGVWLFKI